MPRPAANVRIAITAGGLLLAAAAGACGTTARESPPAAVPLPPTVVGDNLAWRPLSICVADSSGLREVAAAYNVATGDTTIDGRPFAEVYPRTERYAAAASWYVNNEPIEVDGLTFIKYGIPRAVSPRDVVRGPDHQGVPTFTEAADAGNPPGVLYVAVGADCVLQSYQRDLLLRGVRG